MAKAKSDTVRRSNIAAIKTHGLTDYHDGETRDGARARSKPPPLVKPAALRRHRRRRRRSCRRPLRRDRSPSPKVALPEAGLNFMAKPDVSSPEPKKARPNAEEN